MTIAGFHNHFQPPQPEESDKTANTQALSKQALRLTIDQLTPPEIRANELYEKGIQTTADNPLIKTENSGKLTAPTEDLSWKPTLQKRIASLPQEIQDAIRDHPENPLIKNLLDALSTAARFENGINKASHTENLGPVEQKRALINEHLPQFCADSFLTQMGPTINSLSAHLEEMSHNHPDFDQLALQLAALKEGSLLFEQLQQKGS